MHMRKVSREVPAQALILGGSLAVQLFNELLQDVQSVLDRLADITNGGVDFTSWNDLTTSVGNWFKGTSG